jgi:hypothetical protein
MYYREVIYIALGILLLMMGRKLFWLFVGGLGFVAGIEYAGLLLHGQPEWVALVAALVMAVVGLVLAIVMQRVGVGIAGFIAGGYSALSVVQKLGYSLEWLPWVIFLAGGVVGVLLVMKLFDGALIVLSSLTGAFLIIETTQFNQDLTKILFIVLLVAGVAAQASQPRQGANNKN